MVSRTRDNKRRNGKRSRRVQMGGKLGKDVIEDMDMMSKLNKELEVFTLATLDKASENYDKYKICTKFPKVCSVDEKLILIEEKLQQIKNDNSMSRVEKASKQGELLRERNKLKAKLRVVDGKFTPEFLKSVEGKSRKNKEEALELVDRYKLLLKHNDPQLKEFLEGDDDKEVDQILDYFDLEKDQELRKIFDDIDDNRNFMLKFRNWVKGQHLGSKKFRKHRKTKRRKKTKRKSKKTNRIKLKSKKR